ncbi:MAG: nucleotidyltransferase family protein [Treponema sp.]|nr:nucleotidyltransferase family protein [Treponema sp.]MBP3607838.1 nucleotidyltransferase family protein [Treponema sp.]
MKSIILAAGYATRLYPLTENFPKPLLKIGEKSILDRLIDDIDKLDEIDEHIVISNHKFFNHFNQWKNNRVFNKKITILDDGSNSNDNRLGAVKDISFALNTLNIENDILVLAGDNVLDFSLREFVEYQKKHNSSCIMRHLENDLKKLQKTGVATIDENEKVILMEEKPKNPKSNWAIPPFYIYKKSDLIFIRDLPSDCNTDAPGDFISWFCKKNTVYAWEMSGNRFDIGDLDSYNKACELFSVE